MLYLTNFEYERWRYLMMKIFSTCVTIQHPKYWRKKFPNSNINDKQIWKQYKQKINKNKLFSHILTKRKFNTRYATKFLSCFHQVNFENYKRNIKNELFKTSPLSSHTIIWLIFWPKPLIQSILHIFEICQV